MIHCNSSSGHSSEVWTSMACLIVFLESCRLLWLIITVMNGLWKPRPLIVIQVVQAKMLHDLTFEPFSFRCPALIFLWKSHLRHLEAGEFQIDYSQLFWICRSEQKLSLCKLLRFLGILAANRSWFEKSYCWIISNRQQRNTLALDWQLMWVQRYQRGLSTLSPFFMLLLCLRDVL